MDFEIPESLAAVQARARCFVQEELFPLEASYLQHQPVDARLIQRKAREVELWAPAVSIDLGGLGLGLLGQVLIEEEIGKSIVPCSIGNEPAAFFLTLCDDVQQKAFLQPVVNGDRTICFALSEPEAGSDVGSIKTTIGKAGDSIEINGAKHMVVSLDRSDEIIVLGKQEGTGSLTACVVDKSAPGVRVVRSVELMDGTKAFQVELSACKVPLANQLGPAEGASRLLERTHLHWNACIAARALGLAKRAIEMASGYANKRSTFGQTLSSYQAIQFKIADASMAILSAQYMLYSAAWMVDSQLDAHAEVAAAKVFATEAATRSIDESMQIHGAAGLSSDLPFVAMYRRARQYQLESVPSEVLKRNVALAMLRGNYLLGSVMS